MNSKAQLYELLVSKCSHYSPSDNYCSHHCSRKGYLCCYYCPEKTSAFGCDRGICNNSRIRPIIDYISSDLLPQNPLFLEGDIVGVEGKDKEFEVVFCLEYGSVVKNYNNYYFYFYNDKLRAIRGLRANHSPSLFATL